MCMPMYMRWAEMPCVSDPILSCTCQHVYEHVVTQATGGRTPCIYDPILFKVAPGYDKFWNKAPSEQDTAVLIDVQYEPGVLGLGCPCMECRAVRL